VLFGKRVAGTTNTYLRTLETFKKSDQRNPSSRLQALSRRKPNECANESPVEREAAHLRDGGVNCLKVILIVARRRIPISSTSDVLCARNPEEARTIPTTEWSKR
jgi:hypothetical protein